MVAGGEAKIDQDEFGFAVGPVERVLATGGMEAERLGGLGQPLLLIDRVDDADRTGGGEEGLGLGQPGGDGHFELVAGDGLFRVGADAAVGERAERRVGDDDAAEVDVFRAVEDVPQEALAHHARAPLSYLDHVLLLVSRLQS